MTTVSSTGPIVPGLDFALPGLRHPCAGPRRADTVPNRMARQSSRPESGRHGTTGASFDETARSFSDRLLGLLSRKNPLWPPGQATHPELLRLWGRMYDATEDLRRQSS